MKCKLFLVFFLLLGFTHLSSESAFFYNQKNIKLKAVPEFGKGTDWVSLYGIRQAFTMAPDGSFFIANTKQHEIYKFDKNGQLISKFGQKGRGPGDLYVPGSMAILDKKYLVVCEGAMTKRISIFNLSGKFVRTLKTRYPNFHIVALKNNTIAYFSLTFPPGKKSSPTNRQIVSLMNIESGKEKMLYSIVLPQKGHLGKKNGESFTLSTLGGLGGSVVLTATKDGNLLVGVSNKPEIKIYSPEGQLVNTFPLKLSPLPVTSEYKEKYKRFLLKTLREGNDANDTSRSVADILEGFSFDPAFCGTLPLYHNIFVDGDNNILVFKWTDRVGDRRKEFQVYSNEGKYLCASQLDQGEFDIEIKSNLNSILFSGKNVFGVFYVYDPDQDEKNLELVKASLTIDNGK